MPIAQSELEKMLAGAFPEAAITVTDMAGDMDHYSVRLVSPRFAGQPRVKRHQMVYAALGDLMKTTLHAMKLETLAPGEG